MTGSSRRRLRIMAMVSATGANLTTLLALARDRPDLAEVALVVSDRASCGALDVARRWGVAAWPGTFSAEVGLRSNCRSAGDVVAYTARARAYHDRLLARVRDYEATSGPIDLVVLAYHRWVDGEFLRHFRGRMINQHPGDLSVLDGGARVLVGRDPVRLAIDLGHPGTRTSTFVVDETRDGGPVVALGPSLPYRGTRPATRESADAHELRQKAVSDRPALLWTVQAIAEGRVAVSDRLTHPDGSAVVLVDGMPTALGGVDLDTPHVPAGAR